MGDTNTKLMQQRSFKLFEMGLKQKTTAAVYIRHLNTFQEFAKVKDYDGLLEADQKSIQRLVEDYLMYLRGKISPNSIRGYMAPIELFYAMNDVTLNTKKLHKMFPSKVKAAGYLAYTREDIQAMLDKTTSCLQTTNDGTNATESGIYARVNAEFAIHATNESLDKATGRAYLP